ncbi:MAG: tellurite resistance/C4-dicarboxylate transporter family protein [Alphaproteobacteria bacterium]|nr:tellurite resistance/C4-dicarboxylate transporter family protein [Alphaproteobacteria bacterium]MBV8412079.1 tellurite resistance/C4-dicarboxylate transporter family protein [Alphaproteobacteria bacterium]
MKFRFARGRRDELATLHPACFAMVMATGIVAIAAHLHDLPQVANALFWLNALFLAVLVLAAGARLLRHRREVAADLCSLSRGVGFFTMPAAAAVFGTQLDLQRGDVRLATVFWVIAVVLWLCMTYGLLPVLATRRDKLPLAGALNGGWLVIVVAPQSVVILAVLLAAHGAFAAYEPALMFAALTLWLAAGALYLWVITLIVYRLAFLPLGPKDLSSPDWINMGAVAISTLAGATLAEHAALSPLVAEVVPFVKGLSLCFWAIATAWIPMLIVLLAWRHLGAGVPIAYEVLDWGGVFPLGMYSASTYNMMTVVNAPFLAVVSKAFAVLALAAWLWVLAGFVVSRAAARPSPA